MLYKKKLQMSNFILLINRNIKKKHIYGKLVIHNKLIVNKGCLTRIGASQVHLPISCKEMKALGRAMKISQV